MVPAAEARGALALAGVLIAHDGEMSIRGVSRDPDDNAQAAVLLNVGSIHPAHAAAFLREMADRIEAAS
ncbi:hypothetical protein F4X33_10495 [Candidatus Poribacteria bacterium]|nr:hypothetical protein [Candidatus Poribacteria bacterium]